MARRRTLPPELRGVYRSRCNTRTRMQAAPEEPQDRLEEAFAFAFSAQDFDHSTRAAQFAHTHDPGDGAEESAGVTDQCPNNQSLLVLTRDRFRPRGFGQGPERLSASPGFIAGLFHTEVYDRVVDVSQEAVHQSKCHP